LTKDADEFLVHPRRALCWGGLLLVLVVVAGLLIPAGPLALDSRWSDWMHDLETPFLNHVALVFNALGRGLLRGLTLAGIGLILLVGRRWRGLAAFAVTEALTPLSVNTIKLAVDRPRPPDGRIDAHGSSFPSGHAAYGSATTVALVLLFSRPGRRRPLWFAVAAVASAGMAWSRTYLQVHWLSDVLAGALIGLAVALLSFGGVQAVASPARRRSSRAGGETPRSARAEPQRATGLGHPAAGGRSEPPGRS
jgi:membrane-associated phospholipid phosphatase